MEGRLATSYHLSRTMETDSARVTLIAVAVQMTMLGQLLAADTVVTKMPVILIVGLKCMLAMSHAVLR